MCKNHVIITCFVLLAGVAHSQTPVRDSLAVSSGDLAIDTSIDYDELFNEFDLFLDSILAPRSYWLANIAAGQGDFNFSNKNNTKVNIVRKYIFSPTLGYYSKNGPGITATGNMIKTDGKMNLYQFSLSPSFDYLTDREWLLDLLTYGILPKTHCLSMYLLCRMR
ncbi:MAG: hypothetical protein WDO16_09485 [Bacteroidota bacterium]